MLYKSKSFLKLQILKVSHFKSINYQFDPFTNHFIAKPLYPSNVFKLHREASRLPAEALAKAGFKLQTSNFQLQTFNFKLQTSSRSLATACAEASAGRLQTFNFIAKPRRRQALNFNVNNLVLHE